MERSNKKALAPVLILAACALYMVSGGIRANFGIIVQSLADRAGVTYADVSFAVAVGQLMYGVTQPLFGILALKKSNGFVMILGTLMMAAGLLLTPLAHSTLALLATVGLLFFAGTGAVCFGIIMGTISPVLGEQRASAASGILNASSSVGGSLLSPVMQALQASVGVGRLLLVLSAPVLALLPVCLWIARIAATAAPAPKEAAPTGALDRLRVAVADPDYRRLMVGFGTCGFHMCIIQTHIYSQILTYGIPAGTASLAYTVFGLTGMLGSVLCGFLCQRLPLKNVLGTLYGVRAVIVALFMLLMPKNVFTVFLFITVLGMTGDATVTPTSEIVSRRFGPESLGFLFGITFVCHQIGGFLSSWLGGVFITRSGNYQAIWMMDIALCAIAAAASYRVRRNVVRAESAGKTATMIAPVQAGTRLAEDPACGDDANSSIERVALERLKARGETVTFAESCTGGLLAARLVGVPGASDVLGEAHVTYSNAAKQRILGVRAETLAVHTAVSEACAREMAEGARRISGADWAVSTTGYAGPDGGEDGTPVGTVYIAVAGPDGTTAEECHFTGDRESVRTAAVSQALNALRLRLER